ncbi:prephenate dehydratase [Pleomorphovibrio marinus]|uniref:prephenate dehydratase n=1 Tax=Pleomorphovibrio marinus TaxID=2164132 RepID=UPI000E0B2AAF|nr:prephenate dehydratase [Pleomorphovibrio marinus]
MQEKGNLIIAIQGVPGSFHHLVAQNYFGEDISLGVFHTFEEVAKSVGSQESDFAVMAIENSIAGAILPNYDIIDRHGLYIKDEYYLPISHNLMALPGQKISEIAQVRSHPMALLQCKPFFSQYPHIQLLDDTDTAYVAKVIAEEAKKGVGAIASSKAADYYGLEILASDIQTVKSNFTRFIILQKEKPEFSEIPDKVSLKITIQNQKGTLAKLLTLMSEHELDLTKIQSLPVISKPWEYAFFIDTIIGRYDLYQEAILRIQQSFGEVKIFGEYKHMKS